jgi:alkylation response protein AidB-like acyl-CoA dehydrogenase
MARLGYLGAMVPATEGGQGLDMITFGLLNEELGRGCSSVRSLLTVHSMVAYTVFKWGTTRQKAQWLAKLATGEIIGAFGLSEPQAGSDARSIQTTARRHADGYMLDGCKTWMSFGQLADLFLVFAHCEGKPVAFLVERHAPGLTTSPIRGLLGTRASMLAKLQLNECYVPQENQIGGLGFGLAAVAAAALDIGRYSVACGCVGITQACLEASLRHACERRQFATPLIEQQLIRQMVSDMITNVSAARLLCYQAGYSKDVGHPNTVMETCIAKYFASTTAMKAASDAVQIHGASGCSEGSPVQRYMRDAKIMEIIEGSTQIQQVTIAQYGVEQMSTWSGAAAMPSAEFTGGEAVAR